MYKPKYFKASELVDKVTFEKYGERALMLFDKEILVALDGFRSSYGESISINKHSSGRENSGLRALNTTVGAKRSKHKEGIAFDVRATDMDKLRAFIKKHDSFFRIARVENFEYTPTWCHIEFSKEAVKETYYFNP